MQVILDRAMGTHETHKKEPAVTDDAKEASGSTSFIGEVEHATTNVPGGSLREVSPPVVSESGQESRRKDGGAGESDSESDKDSEFAEEDLVASIARQANDETQSQGVGRAQFRVSKTFKVRRFSCF